MSIIEQLIILVIVGLLCAALGVYLAKKSAASADSIEAEGFDKVSSVVTLLGNMRSSIDADITAATAKKAHLDSSIASFKETVSKL